MNELERRVGGRQPGDHQTSQDLPVGGISHNSIPHSIGSQEEAEEEDTAGNPLDSSKAATRWPVPYGEPDVLVKEASLEFSHQEPLKLPQGSFICCKHLLLHEAPVGLSLHRQPVIDQKEGAAGALQIPDDDVLQEPGRAESFVVMPHSDLPNAAQALRGGNLEDVQAVSMKGSIPI